MPHKNNPWWRASDHHDQSIVLPASPHRASLSLLNSPNEPMGLWPMDPSRMKEEMTRGRRGRVNVGHLSSCQHSQSKAHF